MLCLVDLARLFLLLRFALPSLAAPPALVVKESLPAIPRGWKPVVGAPPEHVLHLQLGLRQADPDRLYDVLLDVSDPRREGYGRYLGKEDVAELVKPHESSVEAAEAWLAKHAIPGSAITRNHAGDWLTLSIPIHIAEEMLDTEYHIYQHEDGSSLVRCLSWSLPAELHDHIEFVQPTTIFSRPKPQRSFVHSDQSLIGHGITLSNPTNCSAHVTPACIQQLYGLEGYRANASAPNRFGIAGYLASYANMNDTRAFFEEFVPKAYDDDYMFSVELVNGGLNDQSLLSASLEGNLDVQYGGGISFPIPYTYYSTGGSPPFDPSQNTPQNTNEPYAEFLSYMLNKSNDELPTVLSTSYGDEEQTVPYSYAVRICNLFAQLGARGVSVLFSSGDGGVGDGQGPNQQSHACVSNDGNNTPMFLPVFPASCPFVTAVGATSGVPEVAAYFSGGGFSNYFPRPYWQDGAVNAYALQIPKTYSALYNTSGRAYPDVSAQGNNFIIMQSGNFTSGYGTSCSCPTFAGVIALLNDFLISRGKSPLGFLNPWLYIVGSLGFNDISSGSNPGCGTNGFTAVGGWDPVTGVGSPNFTMLMSLLSLSL